MSWMPHFWRWVLRLCKVQRKTVKTESKLHKRITRLRKSVKLQEGREKRRTKMLIRKLEKRLRKDKRTVLGVKKGLDENQVLDETNEKQK